MLSRFLQIVLLASLGLIMPGHSPAQTEAPEPGQYFQIIDDNYYPVWAARITDSQSNIYFTDLKGAVATKISAAEQVLISAHGYRDTIYTINSGDTCLIKLEHLPPAKLDLRMMMEHYPYLTASLRPLTGSFLTKQDYNISGYEWGNIVATGTRYKIKEDIEEFWPKELTKQAHFESTISFWPNDTSSTTTAQNMDDIEDELRLIADYRQIFLPNIRIMNINYENPFVGNGRDEYSLELLSMRQSPGGPIYDFDLIPSPTLNDALTGTVTTDSSMNILRFRLSLSGECPAYFVDSLIIAASFGKQGDNYILQYFECAAELNVVLVKHFFNIKTRINSLYCQTSLESASAVSPRDNSAAPADVPEKQAETAPWKYKLRPYFDFNRTSSISLGAKQRLSGNTGNVEFVTAYSFGQKQPIGSISAEPEIYNCDAANLSAKFDLYTEIATMSRDNSYPRIMNSMVAAFLHKDYYDYYRRDGWGIGIMAAMPKINIGLSYNQDRHFSLQKTTNNSLFFSEDFRTGHTWPDNPEADEGYYKCLRLKLSPGKDYEALPMAGAYSRFELELMYGLEHHSRDDFVSLEFKGLVSLELFSGVFEPHRLDMLAHLGRSSADIPVQYMFRMHTDMSIFSRFGNFFSAPKEKYGGTKCNNFHIRYNMTDYWWRLLGLPLFKGRGPELELTASAGNFYTSDRGGFLASLSELKGLSEFNDYYTEIGFSLARLPIVVSNVVRISLHFRWGVGRLGAGHWGWGFSAEWPFRRYL